LSGYGEDTCGELDCTDFGITGVMMRGALFWLLYLSVKYERGCKLKWNKDIGWKLHVKIYEGV